MKKLFLLTILASLSLLSFSQFRNGYIIDNGNDTIHGFIKWEGSIINSSVCTFRKTPEADIQTFKPGDINAFRFNEGKYFSTHEIKVDGQTREVFIEWLIRGRASLMMYPGIASDNKYYLLLEDGTITELTNSVQQFEKDGIAYERKKQEYINTLLFNFRDCPSLETKIKSTPFTSNGLLKITKEYHEMTCTTEDCLVFEEKDRRIHVSWGVYSGYMNSRLIINNVVPEKAYPVNSFGFGLALDIQNLPGLPPKFSAKAGASVESSLFTYDTTGVWELISDNRICKITFVRVPVQLAYRFSYNKLAPYIAAGLTFNYRFGYKQYDQFLTDWITRSRPGNYTSKVNPLQYGFNGGPGLEYTVSPSLKLDFGYDFEYCTRLFGTYAEDHSRVQNHVVYLRAYFGKN